jgi:hypothetical protein
MAHADLDAARRLHRSLREIVFYQFGGWKDEDTLRHVAYLCERAGEQVEDEACRRKLQLVRGYAGELFSDDEHRKWDSGGMAGSDVLRLEILELLDAFRARLAVIEAARAATASRERAAPCSAEIRG